MGRSTTGPHPDLHCSSFPDLLVRITDTVTGGPLTGVVCNPAPHRFLTTATVHQLMSNYVDAQKTVEVYTAFNLLHLDHCWTRGALEEDLTLTSIESRAGFGIQLPFTVKDSLQAKLNCNKIFGTYCQGNRRSLHPHGEATPTAE